MFRDNIISLFYCDDLGDMKEYVGCKIYRENRSFKFTQLVMAQSLKYEFDMPYRVLITPGEPDTTLAQEEEDGKLYQKRTAYL